MPVTTKVIEKTSTKMNPTILSTHLYRVTRVDIDHRWVTPGDIFAQDIYDPDHVIFLTIRRPSNILNRCAKRTVERYMTYEVFEGTLEITQTKDEL